MSTLSATTNSLNLSSLYERAASGRMSSLSSMYAGTPTGNAATQAPTSLRFATRYSDDSDRSDSSSPQEAESMSVPLSLVNKTSNIVTNQDIFTRESFAPRNTSVIVSPLKQAKSKLIINC